MYVMSLIEGYQRYARWEKAFDSALLLDYLSLLPKSFYDPKRQKRTYISALLSKNEVDGSDKYNKYLFKRVAHGQYLINPELVMKVNGEWHPIYQSMNVQRVDFYMDELDVPELANDQHWQAMMKRVNQFNRNRSSAFFDLIGRAYDDNIEP